MCGEADEAGTPGLRVPKTSLERVKNHGPSQPGESYSWKLCEKWKFNRADKWYLHQPEKVLELDQGKILWDFPVQTDKQIEHNRPDITVMEKINKIYQLTELGPVDTRVEKEEVPRAVVGALRTAAKTWNVTEPFGLEEDTS